MKSKVVIILASIILTTLTGCAGMTAIFTSHGRLTSTAETAFENGDFDEAVRNTVKALIIKPEYEKAQRLLISSFNPAVLKHEESISSLTGSRNLDHLSQIVDENQILVELNRLVGNLPPVIDKNTNQPLTFETKDFSEDLLKAKQIGAEAFYQEGEKIGKEGGLSKSRTASNHFKKVISYVPRFKDAVELAKKYRKAGTKRVAIIPFLWPEDQSKYKMSGKSIVENLKQAMIIQNRDQMEYLDFVSYAELSNVLSKYDLGQQGLKFDRKNAIKIGKELDAHELIIGNVTELSITSPNTTENKKRETTKIKTTRQKNLSERTTGAIGDIFGGKKIGDAVEKNAKDSNTVVEYVPIYAEVTVRELKADAKVTGFYNVINMQKVSSHESSIITGEYIFSHKWATFSGDEKALSKDTKKLLKNNTNKKAPAESLIVNNAVNDFSKSLISNLKEAIFSIEGYL